MVRSWVGRLLRPARFGTADMATPSDGELSAVALAAGRLGDAVRNGRFQPEIATYVTALCALPPEQAIPVEKKVRRALEYAAVSMSGQYVPRQTAYDAEFRNLEICPALAYYYVFHYSGFVREHALRVMPGLHKKAIIAAIVLERRNDWVAEVRAMADRRFMALLAELPEAQLASLFPVLLERTALWGRRYAPDRVLEEALSIPRFAEGAKRFLLKAVYGPLRRDFSRILGSDCLDADLEEIAVAARAPLVRATAVEALLRGRARWMIGSARQWVDKPNGVSMALPQWETRALTISPSRRRVWDLAASDRSAFVRREAVDYSIDMEPDACDWAVLTSLRHDPNRGVAERAKYCCRKWSAPEKTL